jgi:YHS domain-containing protein
MRVILILILIVIAIGLARMLVGDVIKAVGKTMKSAPDVPPANPQGASSTGRLVKDPETGNYIDESTALKAEVKGTTYCFESAASREAFLRKQRS